MFIPFIYVVLRIEASHVLGKPFIVELSPSPLLLLS